MNSLFEIDFEKDSFKQYISSFVKDCDKIRNIMLAYRFAKYAYLNKYFKDSDEPQTAVRILIQEFNITSIDNVTTLLLSYVTRCSALLTLDDVEHIFGQTIKEKLMMIDTIERIANSRANITNAKQKKYETMFSKEVIIISSCYILAALKLLELDKAKMFPIKVFNRYLPIFEIFQDVRMKVFSKFKKLLIRKVNVLNTKNTYNLTSGDIFKYWQILS